jgi:hypothetical protein
MRESPARLARSSGVRGLVPLLVFLTALPAGALDEREERALVDAARELLDVPYDLGGRLQPGRGTDCQGLLFYAAERVGRCGWKSFSVMPATAIPRGELGTVVDGMGPVSSTSLDVSRLRPGDVIWFVGFAENPAEGPSGELGGREVWVWHTAMFTGGGAARDHFIVGDHYAGRVVEESLPAYLARHADTYAGIIVTRMDDGPKPARCRRHRRMKRTPE